jgi:hypothetical protein
MLDVFHCLVNELRVQVLDCQQFLLSKAFIIAFVEAVAKITPPLRSYF